MVDGVGAAHEDVVQLGNRIRTLRIKQQVTLQDLAAATGLSVSMISAVERGRANPSIGTLIAIADALHVTVVALFGMQEQKEASPVTRRAEQPVVRTEQGFVRRMLAVDRTRGIEMVLNEYEPGAASNPTPSHHNGYEFGVVLEGELEVHLDGRVYRLSEGDAVAYRSTQPHRTVNQGNGTTRTIWVNLYGER